MNTLDFEVFAENLCVNVPQRIFGGDGLCKYFAKVCIYGDFLKVIGYPLCIWKILKSK